MDCKKYQSELISYLYNELSSLEEQLVKSHLDQCSACTDQLVQLAEVSHILDCTTPKTWTSQKTPIYQSILLKAAIFLMGIGLGWYSYLSLWPPKPPVKKPVFAAAKIIQILAQNQEYRASLSTAQKLLVQEMEKLLAKESGIASYVSELHHLEDENNSLKRRIFLQKKFLANNAPNKLTNIICKKLAHNLIVAHRFKEAANVYTKLLAKPLAPYERGKYLWQLAQCCLKQQKPQYKKLLGELEQDKIYGEYYWKAVKILADEDYKKLQFMLALHRYQKYLKSGREDSKISRRVAWITHHQKDNFYPLALFVQAQQKGIDEYYGLEIILTQYPDSPLAFNACKMFLKNSRAPIYNFHNKSFPISNNTRELLKYLGDISKVHELQQVAMFSRYWMGYLQETQMQQPQKAIKIYRKLLKSDQITVALKKLVKESMDRIEKNLKGRKKL